MHRAGDEHLAANLRAAGVKPTAQRLDIARVLFERPQHLSAEQLIERLRRAGRRAVSKATVYNTLGLFARVGLVREVFAHPSRVLYDSNISNHHHLYDLDTGTLTDIPAGEVSLGTLPETAEGTEIAGVDVIIRVRRRRD